jgi:hypothetical protein
MDLRLLCASTHSSTFPHLSAFNLVPHAGSRSSISPGLALKDLFNLPEKGRRWAGQRPDFVFQETKDGGVTQALQSKGLRALKGDGSSYGSKDIKSKSIVPNKAGSSDRV